MNTTATCSSDHIWSRRCSTETVFSIQGQETDVVRDTSDTECSGGSEISEYEPVTESEGEAPVEGDTTGQSDNEIISTRVIEVRVADNEDADSEKDEGSDSDSEIDLCDYWHCAQCRAANNNPRYRYCQKCFKVRKSFFPPRPKAKRKRIREPSVDPPRTFSQDSGVDLVNSQDSQRSLPDPCETNTHLKRRSDSVDITNSKRIRLNSNSGSDDDPVSPIVKTVSDPQITIDNNLGRTITKKVLANSLPSIDGKDLCMVCYSEPKSGVFVHGRIAHICCCYKCAVKVWATAKRCPVCNCKVSNVLKAIVM